MKFYVTEQTHVEHNLLDNAKAYCLFYIPLNQRLRKFATDPPIHMDFVRVSFFDRPSEDLIRDILRFRVHGHLQACPWGHSAYED